jgi:hypothetical protein
MSKLECASMKWPGSIDVHDLYRVVVPSILIGTLMVLVDIYATPWFSEMWWVLHPGH